MQPITLIATDIDGTLLGSHGVIPPPNIAALRQVQARGVHIVMVTARKQDSTMHIADRLGIPYAMICQAGATMYDYEGQLLANHAMDNELAQQIAAFADTHEYGMVTTIHEKNYYTRGVNLQERPEFPGRLVANNRVALVASPTRILLTGEQAALHALEYFAGAALQMNRHYQDGVLRDVVITAQHVTKQQSLAALCRHWGIAASSVLALGDAEADIGMLQWAGMGVAMGNAEPEVKAIANWIAPTNDQAGVAAAVQRYLFSE
jgi:5-amino-6-(5-phospho-D-ribitylamino)uracil phosphatase